MDKEIANHEPVEVESQQDPQHHIEEEVERYVDRRRKVKDSVAGGVQHLQWEPVEATDEPKNTTESHITLKAKKGTFFMCEAKSENSQYLSK